MRFNYELITGAPARNIVIIRAASSPRDSPIRFWEFNLAFLA